MKLTDQEIESIVASELEEARSYIDTEVSPLRATATRYYKGEPFGTEQEGRSSVVSHDVRDTVNAILPSLMRVFFSSEKPVEYIPTGPEDEAFAAQATEYANYVFQQDNDGFGVTYSTFKDSLIRKCGIVKIWWDATPERKTVDYTGLDEGTVMVLMSEPDTTVKITNTTYETGSQPDPMTGQPIPIQIPFFDATVTKVMSKGRIRVAAVPPEEFLIDRRAKSIEDATLVAHRKLATVSELVSMGYDRDEVESHISVEDFNTAPEFIERSNFSQYPNATASNEAQQRVIYTECYVRLDADDSGITRLHKVCMIGQDKLLHKELCDCVPFADFPCDPEPHLNGLEAISIADVTMDVQRIKSEILRNSLDSLAQTLNPRTVIVEGQVNVDDVLNNEVGSMIRVRAPGMVQSLDTPNTSQQAFPMLEYMDNVKESRTGMSQASMGLDPDALQSTTRAAVAATISASQGKIELLARILSVGFKKVFKILLHLMVTHQDQARMVRLRNQWVKVDPRVWDSSMDVTINVALGTGNEESRINTLMAIAAKQELLLQTLGPSNPVVSLANYANTLRKMTELAGFKDSSLFFNALPPDFQMPPAPPQVDPQAQAAEMLAQVEREKAQMKMQIDAAKMEADRQIQEQKLMLEREKFQAEMARKQLELEMQEQKILAELRLKEAESVLKQLTAIRSNQQDQEQGQMESSQQEASEQQQEGLMAQAITALGAMISQSQQATAQAMLTPKQVIRDQTGKVVGVAPTGNLQ